MATRRINLIPAEARPRGPLHWGRQLFTRQPALIVLLTMGLIVTLLWHGTAVIRYRHGIRVQQRRIRTLQTHLREQRAHAEQLRAQRQHLTDQRRPLEQRLALLDEADRHGLRWSEGLIAFSDLVPEELWVTHAIFARDQVTVRGTTTDNEVVSRFMQQLDASPKFRETTFTFTKKAEHEEQAVTEFEVLTRYVE